MSFQTKRIEFGDDTAPYDLAADTDVDLQEHSPFLFKWIAIQNVSDATAYYQETADAPANTATDSGHTLPPGAGIVVMLNYNCPLWIWGAGVTVAVSPAAPDPVLGG